MSQSNLPTLTVLSDVKKHLSERLDEVDNYPPEVIIKRRLEFLLERIKDTNSLLSKNFGHDENTKKISLNLGVAYVDLEETIDAYVDYTNQIIDNLTNETQN